jgi:hypothetical protein
MCKTLDANERDSIAQRMMTTNMGNRKMSRSFELDYKKERVFCYLSYSCRVDGAWLIDYLTLLQT